MKGKTFDRICGVCASCAGYGLAAVVLETVKDRGGLITKAGCVLIQMCVGIGIGEKVEEKVCQVREAVIATLDESEV